MSDEFPSLLPFPEDSRDRLPAPRRDWGRLVWPACALLTAIQLILALRGLAPAAWLLGVMPGPALLGWLAYLGVCGAVVFGMLVAALLYAAARSERMSR